MSLKQDDPKAAADFYRAQRISGEWQPRFGESLMMLQTTEHNRDELLKLMHEVDNDLGPPPDPLTTGAEEDTEHLLKIMANPEPQ